MTNAELIEALRYCGNFADRNGCDEACPYFNDKDCPNRIMCDAADAIEADEKHINELTTKCNQLQAAVDNYEKRIAELEAQEPTEKQVVDYCHKRCLVIVEEELFQRMKATFSQLPKEGEWIEANTRPRSAQFYCSVCHRTCYDIQPTRDKAYTKRCRYHYCPNCGARMKRGEEK